MKELTTKIKQMQKIIALDGQTTLELTNEETISLRQELRELKTLFQNQQRSSDPRTFYDAFPTLGAIYGFL